MKDDKKGLVIGAGTMIGLGVGFFLLPNGVAFVGSIMVGIGLGLAVASFMSKK